MISRLTDRQPCPSLIVQAQRGNAVAISNVVSKAATTLPTSRLRSEALSLTANPYNQGDPMRAGILALVFVVGSLLLLTEKMQFPSRIARSMNNLAAASGGSPSIRFVAAHGRDDNDGLTWQTAKRTLSGALISLPGGSPAPPTAGSGTIYVGDGSYANSVPGAGLWLIAPGDPSYNHPPLGWLRSSGAALRIEGIATGNYGPNAHRPRASLLGGDNNDIYHPGIWLSHTQSPIEIVNLAIFYPGRAIVIGECSNHLRNGTCAVAGVTLENISVAPMSAKSLGPGIDITGGSFWVFLRDVSVSGNAYQASEGPLSDRAAGILIDGKGNAGNGLIHLRDMNLAGGGVKFTPGANGGSLYVENLTEEGDGVHTIPPPVRFTGYNGFVDAYLSNIQVADPGPGLTPAVQNDGDTPGPLVAGAVSLVTGPAIVLSQYANSLAAQKMSPLLQRQVGFFEGHVIGQSDNARRIGGPTAVRFPNRALTEPSSWTTTQYAGHSDLQVGREDLFGGLQAGTATSDNNVPEVVFLTGQCTAVTLDPSKTEWILAGAWVKSATGGYAGSPTRALSISSCGKPEPKFHYFRATGGEVQGDGEWQWQWVAGKLASGQSTSVSLAVSFSKGHSVTIYGPVLYLVPLGAISDNEALEFINSAATVDSNCSVGSICGIAGHPFVAAAFGTLANCVSSSQPALCKSAATGSFIIPVNSVSATVLTSAVTANSQIFITEDSSLEKRLGMPCDAKGGMSFRIAERKPGQSFSVTTSQPSAQRAICLSYGIFN